MAEQDGFHTFDAPSRRAVGVGRESWASDAAGRVLLLDGDDLVRDSITRTLAGGGHDVHAVAEPIAALHKLQNGGCFDLFLADVNLPRPGAGEWVAGAMRLRPALPLVVMTGYAGVASAVELVRRGAYDFLQKPFDKEQLLLLVGRTLGHAALRHEVRALRANAAADRFNDPLDSLPLAAVEKRVILDTLAKFEGHRARTAGALGIGVRTLGIKLKKWREAGEAVR